MRSRWLTCLFVLILSIAALAQGDKNSAPSLSRFAASDLDTSQSPCENFYKFTCSKWLSANPIPADMPITGTALPLFMWNQTVLRDALVQASQKKDRDATEQKIGDHWASCMDESGRSIHSKEWLANELKAANGLQSKKDIATVVAYIHRSYPAVWAGDDNETHAAIFGFGPTQDLADSSKMVAGLDQGGLVLPSRKYYLETDEKSKTILSEYQKHVQRMFQMAGDTPEQAAKETQAVLAIENEMAKSQMDAITRRDPEKLYNKRTLAELKQMTPSFDWDTYFAQVKSPKPAFYIVSSPAFFAALEQELKNHSVDDWRSYLRWWTIRDVAGSLGTEWEQANFDFFGKVLSGTPQMLPQWRRCVGAADRDLGEAVGKAYVAKAFPPESKEKALELVNEIRNALKQDIAALSWMSPETKKQAEIKLNGIYQKIGYPDTWRDYSAVTIRPDNYLENVKAATFFEFQRQLGKIGNPVDRKEWSITPATLDAYYDPQMNTINFPAGILQPPFFSGTQEDALNFGGIGVIIGHEIIHGFDDEGRKFDAQGNLRDWWTKDDAKSYTERGECIAKQYSVNLPEYGVKQDGHLTQGEDTADNGGMHLAMIALENMYKKKGKSLDEKDSDGYTPRQKFFIANSFGWCRALRPELARMQILTNPHSLGEFRATRPAANMIEFQQAFQCKAGQAMTPENRCRVW